MVRQVVGKLRTRPSVAPQYRRKRDQRAQDAVFVHQA
jgi:hypothetical protein